MIGKFEVLHHKEHGKPERVAYNGDVAKVFEDANKIVESQFGAVKVLMDRNASWTTHPASDAQLTQLKKMRVPFSAGITKGDASDLLDKAFSGRKNNFKRGKKMQKGKDGNYELKKKLSDVEVGKL